MGLGPSDRPDAGGIGAGGAVPERARGAVRRDALGRRAAGGAVDRLPGGGPGLNNYLAWLAPAACLFAAHFALWGYSPNPGAGLLTALLSLVGAAAGQVLKERGGKRKHTRQSRR